MDAGRRHATPSLEIEDLIIQSRKSCQSIRMATSVPCIPATTWSIQVHQDGVLLGIAFRESNT